MILYISVLLLLKFADCHECHQASGATYTRWGRTACPADAELVYKGYAGGGFYDRSGSGVNYVCLPEEPIWGNYDDTASPITSYMFGTEYELVHAGHHKDIFGPGSASELHDYDVPCAVCQCKVRSRVLMIPARKECFSGWTLEYWGYLMNERHTHNSGKDFICVDGNPNRRPGSNVNHNGALLYPVEARCGSLPCPPYLNYRELTCAVCTK